MYNIHMPIYKCVNKKFFKKWTDEMAYVLGFIFADGNIIKTKRDTWFLSIQITDREILYKMRDCLSSNHKISKRVLKENHKTLYRLQIGSKEICNDLMKFCITPRKSKNMIFPEIPQKFQPHFIRGYFDGDGHVWHGKNKKGNLVIITGFTSGSIVFLNELKRILFELGILGGSIVFKEKGYCLQYSIKDSFKLSKIMYNGISQKNQLFLNRKKIVFDKLQS